MNISMPIIVSLTLPNGTELINVPAIESDLIEMGFSSNQASALCLDAEKQQALNKVRAIRKPLLLEADYMINNAVDTNVDTSSFRQYRQALKNITEGLNNPDDVVWPVKPQI